MAYAATMIPVMLASPGDVLEERNIVRDVLHEWNYIHSFATKVALMPVGWETHSAPDLGGRAQELINDRVLADCDLLIGIFWTRLGTPTGDSASGTVEEIQRHLDDGKPAMVYFSSAPVAPEMLDAGQYAALREFRTWCESKGLIETYSNYEEFRSKVTRQVQLLLQQNSYLSSLRPKAPAEIDQRLVEPTQPIVSPEALDLLRTAAKSDGVVMRLATLGGRYIQSGGRTFGDPRDRRSQARWEYALEELVQHGFLVGRGTKGEVFEVTSPGYELADDAGQPTGNSDA